MRVILSMMAIGLIIGGSPAAFAADTEQPLTGKELEMAKEMNDAFARHIYSSTCMERQKAYFLPEGLSQEEISKRMSSFKKSCECITEKVLETAQPNDVVDYVTQTYGTRFSTKTTAQSKVTMKRTPQFTQIGKLSRDKETRKKCGFSQ